MKKFLGPFAVTILSFATLMNTMSLLETLEHLKSLRSRIAILEAKCKAP